MRYVSEEERGLLSSERRAKNKMRRRLEKKVFKFSTDVRFVKIYAKKIAEKCDEIKKKSKDESIASIADGIKKECDEMKTAVFMVYENLPESIKSLVSFVSNKIKDNQ